MSKLALVLLLLSPQNSVDTAILRSFSQAEGCFDSTP